MDIREDLVKVSSLLYQKGLVVAYDGNISVRNRDNSVWISPTKKCKGFLEKDDFVLVNLSGEILESPRNLKPTSETILHLEIYKNREDVFAIIHAHPPYAIAATLTGISLENTNLSEAILVLGDVPTAPYALTGTREMFDAIQPYIHKNAILLSHHGAVTLGRDLWDAYFTMEELEHCAMVLCIAKSIGATIPLPEDRKKELVQLREKNYY